MVCYLLPPAYSGAATQALRLARALSKRGARICLVGGRLPGESSLQVFDGVQIVRLPAFQAARPFLRVRLFGIALTAWLAANRHNYGLVHYHGFGGHVYIPLLLNRALHTPSIVKLTLMGTDDPLTLARFPLLGHLRMQALSKASVIVSVSPALTQACQSSKLGGRTLEIPNGVDLDLYRPADNRSSKQRQLGLTGRKVVTFVGEISARKGVYTLVEAWKHVVSQVPNGMLLLVGPVQREDKDSSFITGLHERIAEWDLSKHVSFLGQVANVVDYLQVSDVFAFPSRREGLPNALLEAMACEIPAVVSLLPGITDSVIEHGLDGYLVEDYSNAHAFAESILDLLQDHKAAKKMGQLARKTIVKRYSIQKIAAEYIEIYRGLGLSVGAGEVATDHG